PVFVQPNPQDKKAAAKHVAALLNDGHGKPGFEQIERLAQDLNEIERLARKAGYPRAIDAVYCGKLGDAARLLRLRVDKFLEPVKLEVLLGMPGKFGWDAHYSLRFKGMRKFNPIYNTAAFILNAAFSGQLRDVAQCAACRTWYARRRNHQQ